MLILEMLSHIYLLFLEVKTHSHPYRIIKTLMKWIGKESKKRGRRKKTKQELSTQCSISAINAYEVETVIFGIAVIAFGPWRTL